MGCILHQVEMMYQQLAVPAAASDAAAGDDDDDDDDESSSEVSKKPDCVKLSCVNKASLYLSVSQKF